MNGSKLSAEVSCQLTSGDFFWLAKVLAVTLRLRTRLAELDSSIKSDVASISGTLAQAVALAAEKAPALFAYHTVDYEPLIKSRLAQRQLTFRIFYCNVGHGTPECPPQRNLRSPPCETPNPKPKPLNPKPYTVNTHPKPLNPQPYTKTPEPFLLSPRRPRGTRPLRI